MLGYHCRRRGFRELGRAVRYEGEGRKGGREEGRREKIGLAMHTCVPVFVKIGMALTVLWDGFPRLRVYI